MLLQPKAKKGPDGPLKPVKTLNIDEQLCSIRFSPDGKMLAGGTFEGSIRRWDFSTNDFAEYPAIGGLNGWVQQVAFHPDNKRLFAVDSWGQIAAWPCADKAPKASWLVKDAHDGWIHAMAINADGSKLISGSRDRTARISATADGAKLAAFAHPNEVMAVAFHPDGKSAVTGDSRGIIRQWDLATGKSVRELDAKSMYLKAGIQDVGGVRCFAFDAEGTTLAAGGSAPASGGFVTGSTLIIVYDWQTGKAKQTFKGAGDKDGYVFDVTLHPDGYLMAVSSGQPGAGKVFCQRLNEADAFVTLPLPNCHSLALHPSGTRLVVSATNANSGGNGRPKNKGGKVDYPGNSSPLHIFDVQRPKS
jgi:WD40 repeat protein